MTFTDATFWVALLQIIGVNIVLSGDNAVVIALAARSLPQKQQKQAVVWGSAAAVVMRIVLTIVAVELLRLPYLKFIGAALLFWIGIQLLMSEDEEAEGGASASAGMIAAIRTILIADLVMSLDNVIAVAAAAKGSILLLTLGLLISIPLVIFGSTILMKFMERWPIIVTIGAALIGWVAGEMTATDPAIKNWVDANAAWLHWGAPVLGAALVVGIGKWLESRAEANEAGRPVVDLASSADQHATTTAAPHARILLVADDSPASLRGVERFVERLAGSREPVAVDLVNVQSPVHHDVSTFVNEKDIKDLHHEEGLKALAPARALLERAGVSCTVHIGVGNLAHVLVHYAQSLNSREIVLTDTTRTETTTMTELSDHVTVPVTVIQ